MSILGLVLILGASFCHALWNYLMKRANGETNFLWLIALFGGLIFSPLIAWLLMTGKAHLTSGMGIACGVAALLTLAFFFALQKGYQQGELSIIYPTARGSGILFAVIGGILLFHDRLTPLIGGGIVLSTCGVAFLGFTQKTGQQLRHTASSLFYGILAGFMLAGLTLWLKYAIQHFKVDPIFLALGATTLPVLFLAPVALKKKKSTFKTFKNYTWEILGVGLFNNASYILLLLAIKITPVIYFAPARETSILWGLLLGVLFLKEGINGKKILGMVGILGGILLLTLG